MRLLLKQLWWTDCDHEGRTFWVQLGEHLANGTGFPDQAPRALEFIVWMLTLFFEPRRCVRKQRLIFRGAYLNVWLLIDRLMPYCWRLFQLYQVTKHHLASLVGELLHDVLLSLELPGYAHGTIISRWSDQRLVRVFLHRGKERALYDRANTFTMHGHILQRYHFRGAFRKGTTWIRQHVEWLLRDVNWHVCAVWWINIRLFHQSVPISIQVAIVEGVALLLLIQRWPEPFLRCNWVFVHLTLYDIDKCHLFTFCNWILTWSDFDARGFLQVNFAQSLHLVFCLENFLPKTLVWVHWVEGDLTTLKLFR